MVWPLLLAAGGLFVGYHAVRIAPRVAARYGAAAASASGSGSLGGHRAYEGSGFLPSMSVHEAQLILGLPSGYMAEDVKKAHRDLMSRNHTDVGGSEVLAQKINEARDLLGGK